MADHSIKGKVVLIAGGAKNLGGLIARDLAAQGAKAVAIHYNSASSKTEADATVAARIPISSSLTNMRSPFPSAARQDGSENRNHQRSEPRSRPRSDSPPTPCSRPGPER